MNHISTLIILLTFMYPSQFYSQSHFRKYHEYKKYSLKAEDVKAVQKDSKTSWAVKTSLTNHSRDTLFYFITNNCEPACFSVDTSVLFVDFQKCETDKHTVIFVEPKGQRIINLEIGAFKSLTSSITFKIMMFIYKAKNVNDSMPHYKLMSTKPALAVSNKIKI